MVVMAMPLTAGPKEISGNRPALVYLSRPRYLFQPLPIWVERLGLR